MSCARRVNHSPRIWHNPDASSFELLVYLAKTGATSGNPDDLAQLRDCLSGISPSSVGPGHLAVFYGLSQGRTEGLVPTQSAVNVAIRLLHNPRRIEVMQLAAIEVMASSSDRDIPVQRLTAVFAAINLHPSIRPTVAALLRLARIDELRRVLDRWPTLSTKLRRVLLPPLAGSPMAAEILLRLERGDIAVAELDDAAPRRFYTTATNPCELKLSR